MLESIEKYRIFRIQMEINRLYMEIQVFGFLSKKKPLRLS